MVDRDKNSIELSIIGGSRGPEREEVDTPAATVELEVSLVYQPIDASQHLDTISLISR